MQSSEVTNVALYLPSWEYLKTLYASAYGINLAGGLSPVRQNMMNEAREGCCTNNSTIKEVALSVSSDLYYKNAKPMKNGTKLEIIYSYLSRRVQRMSTIERDKSFSNNGKRHVTFGKKCMQNILRQNNKRI